ncbi:MAG: hypothetical protein KAT29_10945, partial [Anaerolineales bacterium]|nr:hypothetical protein [Anaerolineales bacterium]
SQELMDRLSGIAVELPPLPGREERGLFLTQKHFAIAMYLTLLKHRTLIMNAEMGFGKTSTSIGGVSILDKWPGLVWCPNHMVYKWRRDLTDASDQKDPITARVITRPTLDSYPVKIEDPGTEENQDLIRARKYYPMGNDIFLAKAPAWLWLKDEIEGIGGTILETERFQINPDHVNDTGMRRRVKISCVSSNAVEEIRLLMFKQSFRSTGKSGTVAIKPEINVEGEIVEATFYDRDEYTMKDFYEDYKAGCLGKKAVAICAFDPVKYDSGWNKEPATRKGSRSHVEEEKHHSREYRAPAHICANCGATIGLLEDNLSINRPRCPECGDAIFNFNRWRRVGLARLVQKRYKHFFKFVIADEVHKTKGGHTDIGVADQRLISSIKYSIALTGTLFGGTAGSIFYLLYRRVPELRILYDHDELFR